MTLCLPTNPEEMRKMSTETLRSFCYDYEVGTAEYEHYYRMHETLASKCHSIAKDELQKRKEVK